MKSKLSRSQIQNQIKDFFSDIKNKSSQEIKKIKKLAMSKNIPLKEKRKLFCKKCLAPYSGKEKIRINKGIKSTRCENCGNISRWKL
jgi:RNase P subunit RPR2